MGLLDSLLGSVLGGGQTQSSPQAALINAVLRMLMSRGEGSLGSVLGTVTRNAGGNQGGLEGLGGLGGLIGALTQGGLGQAANSWVGTGQNMQVSPDEITQALGGGGAGSILAQIAQQAGLSQGEAASGLSQVLPGIIDQLTPDGQLPQQDSLESMLGSLRLGR